MIGTVCYLIYVLISMGWPKNFVSIGCQCVVEKSNYDVTKVRMQKFFRLFSLDLDREWMLANALGYDPQVLFTIFRLNRPIGFPDFLLLVSRLFHSCMQVHAWWGMKLLLFRLCGAEYEVSRGFYRSMSLTLLLMVFHFSLNGV